MLQCLIIEDAPLNYRIMQGQISKMGIQVDICTNGREALEYCLRCSQLPELILLDGCMPEMDGVSFLRHLRQLPGGHRPYVVFCASSDDGVDIVTALDQGAQCHFPKPLTRDQIAYALYQTKKRRAPDHMIK